MRSINEDIKSYQIDIKDIEELFDVDFERVHEKLKELRKNDSDFLKKAFPFSVFFCIIRSLHHFRRIIL